LRWIAYEASSEPYGRNSGSTYQLEPLQRIDRAAPVLRDRGDQQQYADRSSGMLQEIAVLRHFSGCRVLSQAFQHAQPKPVAALRAEALFEQISDGADVGWRDETALNGEGTRRANGATHKD
jgi:hypothetical protein